MDLTTLVAIEAIKQVKARYCRHLDEEDWDAFRSLFEDDAVFDAEGHPFEGADPFVAAIIRHHTLARVRTVHHCHMPEITIEDADHATGVWAMFDYVDRIWADDGRREAFVGYGHYREEYRKHGGQWRIAAMHLIRIRVDTMRPEAMLSFPERGQPVAPVLPG